MALLFIIFTIVVIYAIVQTQNKNEEKKEKEYLERNLIYLKYKELYKDKTKKELKKIMDDLVEDFFQKAEYYEKVAYKSSYISRGDELPSNTKKSSEFADWEFKKSEPEFYYKYCCASWQYNFGKLKDERSEQEYELGLLS